MKNTQEAMHYPFRTREAKPFPASPCRQVSLACALGMPARTNHTKRMHFIIDQNDCQKTITGSYILQLEHLAPAILSA